MVYYLDGEVWLLLRGDEPVLLRLGYSRLPDETLGYIGPVPGRVRKTHKSYGGSRELS
jgi:hypothetical protein